MFRAIMAVYFYQINEPVFMTLVIVSLFFVLIKSMHKNKAT